MAPGYLPDDRPPPWGADDVRREDAAHARRTPGPRSSTMNTQDLYDGWAPTAVAGPRTPRPARPPPAAPAPPPPPPAGPRAGAAGRAGSHTALLEAGLIPDPYLDR